MPEDLLRERGPEGRSSALAKMGWTRPRRRSFPIVLSRRSSRWRS